MNVIKSAQKML